MTALFRPDSGISREGFECPGHVLLGVIRHGAVVDERIDWNFRRNVDHATVVVFVKMRDEQVVDPLESRIANCSQYAIGIATPVRFVAKVVSGKSGIDEQRLSRGRNDQCRLAALDVDEVNLQAVGSRRSNEDRAKQHDDHKRSSHSPRPPAHWAFDSSSMMRPPRWRKRSSTDSMNFSSVQPSQGASFTCRTLTAARTCSISVCR